MSPVHPAYNLSFSACFFSWNSIFLSQQISQQCFSAGLSAQPNGAMMFEAARVPPMTRVLPHPLASPFSFSENRRFDLR
jgi:hypothetical protein